MEIFFNIQKQIIIYVIKERYSENERRTKRMKRKEMSAKYKDIRIDWNNHDSLSL